VTAAFDRARRLLQSPALNWVRECIPVEMRDSPAHLKHLLAYAATIDTQVRDSAAYGEATVALNEVARERDFESRVAALYHNPAVRRAAGDRLDHYFEHPEEAYEALRGNPALLPSDLRQEVMVAIGEAKEIARSNGIAEAAAAAAPAPNDPKSLDSEYRALVAEGASRRLSEAERSRMRALKTAQLEREPAIPGGTPQEQAAHRKALGLPVKPSEYDALVKKSVTGLSAAEHSRMHELAGQRAVTEGRISQEDLAAESSGTSGESDNE
jgi:hypothetical protein